MKNQLTRKESELVKLISSKMDEFAGEVFVAYDSKIDKMFVGKFEIVSENKISIEKLECIDNDITMSLVDKNVLLKVVLLGKLQVGALNLDYRIAS